MNQKSIYDLSRIERYMMQMRPVLSKKALFSDGTKDYRSRKQQIFTTIQMIQHKRIFIFPTV